MQAGGSPGASCLSAGSIYHCLPILGLLCATSVVLAPFIAGFRLSGFGSLNSSLPSCSDWQQTPGADPRNTLHPLSSRRIPASLWVPSLSASRTIVDLAQPCAARTSCTPDAASPLKSDERHHREARHTCSERDGADVGTPLKWRCPSAGDLLLVHVQSILETGEGLATFCLEHTRCACERCHDSGSCEVVCSGSDNADQRNGNSESLRSPDCAASNAFQSRPRENRKRRRNKGSGYPVLQPKKPRWPLFVPFSVPGEHVWVKVRETRAHYSIAFVAAFVAEPSPARVRPRCPYFGSCNGCQYQHMNRSMQHKIKRQHVQNVLRRLGGLGATAPSVNPLIGVKDKKDSEEENLYFYRSKITPHYNFYESGSFPAVGFNDICSPNKVVDVQSCSIARRCVNEKLQDVRRDIASKAASEPPINLVSTHTSSGAKEKWRTGATLLLRETGLESVTTDPADLCVARVSEDIQCWFRAGDFFQVNPRALPLLASHVKKELEGTPSFSSSPPPVDLHPSSSASSPPPRRLLLDCYCGVGLFGLVSHDAFDNVYGFDVSPSSIDLAKYNAQFNGKWKCHFEVSDAGEFFASFFEKTESLSLPLNRKDTHISAVLDPPRKGCSPQFLEGLLTRLQPSRIVYVSCHPASQARDLKVLLPQYTVRNIQPFDMFPHTRHIECVITLDRTSCSSSDSPE